MESMDKEKQLERVMESFKGMQRAEPSPFFADRLSARIQHGNFESRFASESGGVLALGSCRGDVISDSFEHPVVRAKHESRKER